MTNKELVFPRVDGVYYGGDQNWYSHWLMRLGGCSTTTACEACICLARSRSDLRVLYPGDPAHVTKDEFIRFAELMFPHVHPGIGGLTDVERYAHMLRGYAASCGTEAACDTLAGDAPPGRAARFIMEAIDDGRAVSYLMLRHRNVRFDELEWHWFSVSGYRTTPYGLVLVGGTYGRRFEVPLKEAWDTGFAWKGGLASLRAAD